jgi:hypothetical protein
MWSIFIKENRRSGIKTTLLAVLATVFLSFFTQGCYTKLRSSEPKTGEREYYPDYGAYPDDYYDMGFSYYGWGWYRPFYTFSPFFYGMSYYPWWYDPWYYDDNFPVYPPGNKEIRRRIRDTGQLGIPPSGSYTPNPPLEIIPNRGNSAPPAGNNSNDNDKSNEKTPRRRR